MVWWRLVEVRHKINPLSLIEGKIISSDVNNIQLVVDQVDFLIKLLYDVTWFYIILATNSTS